MRLSTIWDKQRLSKIGILGLWLLLWQGLYLVVGEDLLLASPFAVFVRLLQLAGLPSFWYTICWTLGRIMAGFLSDCFWERPLLLPARAPGCFVLFSSCR